MPQKIFCQTCFVISFSLLILLVSCAAPKEVSANKNVTKNLQIPLKDIQIITPKTELKEKRKGQFIKHPQKRESLRKVMLTTIQQKFPDMPYVEVPFMFLDSYTINRKLETGLTFKAIEAPKEIITEGKPYSIFLCTNGYFGDLESGVLYVVLIDNINKTRKVIEHYEYKHSPLKTEKFTKKILKVLDKL
ncbi:hypothetical protein C8N46_111110 [Kordia periserrulae]|uniref:Lipoprotein n=2 Tax=Kordia periserrulae TaxID=701523 RepID=A0A2T6BSH1_9FLAO|nr:hypothetical protein C8N46_111110 [Kordia periserrulae]